MSTYSVEFISSITNVAVASKFTMRYFKLFTKEFYQDQDGNEQIKKSRVGHIRLYGTGRSFLRIFVFGKDFTFKQDDEVNGAEQIVKLSIREESTEDGVEKVIFERVGELRFTDFYEQRLVFDEPLSKVLPKEIVLYLEKRTDEDEAKSA